MTGGRSGDPRHLSLVAAAVLLSACVGGGSLAGKDRCAVDGDCNPGRVCTEGHCRDRIPQTPAADGPSPDQAATLAGDGGTLANVEDGAIADLPESVDSPPDGNGGACVLGGSEARFSCQVQLWPNGRVPYRLSGLWYEKQRLSLESAMGDWTEATGGEIQFVEDHEDPTAVTFIVVADGGEPEPSNGAGPRRQWIDVTDPWATRHIIGHVLGLPDAHQRADRDHFLRVTPTEACGRWGTHHFSYGRCQPDLKFGSRQVTGPDHGPYDPDSVMQVPSRCEAGVCDLTLTDGQTVTATPAPHVRPADVSALAEMYAEAASWSRFRLVPDQSADAALPAAGLVLRESPALMVVDDVLMAVARDLDGALFARRGLPRAGAWVRVDDEKVSSAVAAISRLKGIGEVVAVRGDQLGYRRFFLGVWEPWQSLGAPPGTGTLSAPALAAWGPDRLDLFVTRGTVLHQKTWSTLAGWTEYQEVARDISGTPAAISWGPNRIDVIARAPDESLWHASWDGQWHADSLGGLLQPGTSPAIASYGPNRLSVFGTGLDGMLYERKWAVSQWSTWRKIGGALGGASPAAASVLGGGIHLVTLLAAKGRATDSGPSLVHRAWSVCPIEEVPPRVSTCSPLCPCSERRGGCQESKLGTDCAGSLRCQAGLGAEHGYAADVSVCLP